MILAKHLRNNIHIMYKHSLFSFFDKGGSNILYNSDVLARTIKAYTFSYEYYHFIN